MIYDPRAFAAIRYGVLGASLAAWIFLLGELRAGGSQAPQGFCGTTTLSWLRLDSALSSVVDSMSMLVAMMLPLTLPMLAYVWRASLVRRRRRAVALCLVAYVAVWLLAELGIDALARQLNVLVPPTWAASSVAIVGVLVWQCSPLKQHCLTRCHGHRPLSAFGLRAELDAAMLGVTHGAWCVGSCWALMAATALLPHARAPGMVLAALLMYGERLEPPARPAWRIRRLGTAWGLLRREWLMHVPRMSRPCPLRWRKSA